MRHWMLKTNSSDRLSLFWRPFRIAGYLIVFTVFTIGNYAGGIDCYKALQGDLGLPGVGCDDSELTEDNVVDNENAYQSRGRGSRHGTGSGRDDNPNGGGRGGGYGSTPDIPEEPEEDEDNDCNEEMESSEPVRLDTGFKVERATDLQIRVTGGVFTLSRTYSSANGSNNSFFGSRWRPDGIFDYVYPGSPIDTRTCSQCGEYTGTWDFPRYIYLAESKFEHAQFKHTGEDFTQTGDYQARTWVENLDSGTSRRFVYPNIITHPKTFSGIWPTNSSELVNRPVITVRTPGVGERHFYNLWYDWSPFYPEDNAPTEPQNAEPAQYNVANLLAEERDIYGNRRIYEWSSGAQLDAIWFYDKDNTCEARVRFDYDSFIGNVKRCVEVTAERYIPGPGGGDWYETARVEYDYLILFPDTEPFYTINGDVNKLPAVDAGDHSGLLLQARRYTRVDLDESDPQNTEPFRLQPVQYRYWRNQEYNPMSEIGPRDELVLLDAQFENGIDIDDGEVVGDQYDLRIVIDSAQIEYFTQLKNSESGATEQSLEYRAEELLELPTLDTDPSLALHLVFPGSSHDLVTNPYIVDLAKKYIVYGDDDGSNSVGDSQVLRQYTQGRCGCSGGGGSSSSFSRRLTYSNLVYDDQQSGYSSTLSYHDEHKEDGSWTTHRNVYYDVARFGEASESIKTPVLINRVVETSSGGQPQYWVTHKVYDTVNNRLKLIRKMMSSATQSYTPGSSSTTKPQYTASPDTGRVYLYEYNNDTLERTYSGVREGADPNGSPLTDFAAGPGANTGTVYSLYSIDYSVNTSHLYLPVLMEVFPDPDAGPGSGNDSVETMLYEYEFHPEPHPDSKHADGIALCRTSIERETYAQGGPASPSQPFSDQNSFNVLQYFDEFGNHLYQIHPDKAIDSYQYQTAGSYPYRTGRVIQSVSNAAWPTNAPLILYDAALDAYPPPAEPPDQTPPDYMGRSDPSGGSSASLRTTYQLDPLGRVVAMTSSSGSTTYTRRELRYLTPGDAQNERPNQVYFVQVTIPPYSDSGSQIFSGPASVSWMDAGGHGVRNSSYAMNSISLTTGGASTDHPIATYSIGSEVTRSSSEHDAIGTLLSATRWHDLSSGNPSSGAYSTSYEYDGRGRVTTEIAPNGKHTHYTYDHYNSIIEIAVSDGVSSPAVIEKRFYDYDWWNDSPPAPEQEVGTRRLTYVQSFESSTESRDTGYLYDQRGRLVYTKGPEPPYEAIQYDGLGRVAKRALFESDPSPLPDLVEDIQSGDVFTDTNTNRGFYEEFHYTRRGLMYLHRVATDAGQATDTAKQFLDTYSIFDENGRALCTWGPNGPGQKTRYDGLGRPIVSYTTDMGGDPAPGTDTVGDSFKYAQDVEDDTVLEQTEYLYNRAGIDGVPSHAAGTVQTVMRRMRTHDSTYTGDLASGASTDSIVTFTQSAYDDASRPIRSIAWGTNLGSSTDVLKGGGSPPSAPSPTNPPDWDETGFEDAIITATAYSSSRGLADTTTDPEGRVTKTYFDDLNRTVAVVENYVDATITRSSDDWGWEVNLGAIESDTTYVGDEDRTTLIGYNSIDQTTQQVAINYVSPSQIEQVTEYTYGYSSGAYANPDLLVNTEYPDGDSVDYTYNYLGEVVTYTDQNGIEHTFSRDGLGRMTHDEITDFGTANGIDTRIDELVFTFDGMGRLSSAQSLLSGTTTVDSSVTMAYNDINQVTQVDQMTVCEGNAITGSVDYTYEYAAAPASGTVSGNYSRLDTLEYPSKPTNPNPPPVPIPTALTHHYDSGLDGVISRLSGFSWGDSQDPEGVEYDYLGMDTLAIKDYTKVGLRLDRRTIDDATDTPIAGEYDGYDRFGRIKHQEWRRYLWPSPQSGDAPVVNLEYAYDRNSNILSRLDVVPGPSEPDRYFEYDSVDRLHQDSFTSASTPGRRSERWNLDLLGNWEDYDRELDDDGFDADDQFEDRDHNSVNEITIRHRIIAGLPVGGEALYDSFDPVGNQTQKEINDDLSGPSDQWRYTYDAWNRLVGAEVNPESEGFRWRTRYSYNAMHQRVTRTVNTDESTESAYEEAVDEGEVFFYDVAWRLLESRQFEDFDNDAPEAMTQWVWCPTYIDTLVAFMTDDDSSGDLGDFTDTASNIYYAATDRRHSVVLLLPDTGGKERVVYSAYGVPRALHDADSNGDSVLDTADLGPLITAIGTSAADSDYPPNLDCNFDGVVDTADLGYLIPLGDPTPNDGELSKIGNIVGLSGYLYDDNVSQYCVRYRWLDGETGRWLSRDPLIYMDGTNLYEYGHSNTAGTVDPSGTTVAYNTRARYTPGYTMPPLTGIVLLLRSLNQTHGTVASPWWTDYVVYGELQAKAAVWMTTGRKNAGSALFHYLGNSGNTMWINNNQLFKQSDSAYKTYVGMINSAMQAVESGMTPSGTTDRTEPTRISYWESSDWYATLGGYGTWGRYKDAGCQPNGSCEMKIETWVEDVYDFGNVLRGAQELHYVGIAKSFRIRGMRFDIIKWCPGQRYHTNSSHPPRGDKGPW
ncbi:MAG: hypothetical protein H6814_09170 [Phycisphaeraceae bacterium]|nr:hypothetical protein [Phycisphaeraceae bacterium]